MSFASFLKGFLLGIFVTLIIYALATINLIYLLVKRGVVL